MAEAYEDDPFSYPEVAQALGWAGDLCEGSFYQTDDGVIHMLLRDTRKNVAQRTLWVTQSRDDGETWSKPVKTSLSDTSAKFHFGRLPDGRFYAVGNPVEQGRNPLVLSLSDDGVKFGCHFIIADSSYQMKRTGKAKNGEYGYPHTLVRDGFLHVIVSRKKRPWKCSALHWKNWPNDPRFRNKADSFAQRSGARIASRPLRLQNGTPGRAVRVAV